jgi:hypothetical protein
MPGRIAHVLRVLATLITQARYFAANAHTHARNREFAAAAAVFGTYDLTIILRRVQRGLLRALALQQYLLERAARGINLRFAWPPTTEQYHLRNLPKPERAKRAASAPRRREPATMEPTDFGWARIPTPEELAKEVRSRPIGRTIAFICMDLGLTPGFCGNGFWIQMDLVLYRYGGTLRTMYQVRGRREAAYLRERHWRPDTWDVDWRGNSIITVHRAIGSKFGEPPPVPVPS